MKNRFLLIGFLPVLIGSVWLATAQSTAFTYRGHLLEAGQPTDGSYDLQFRIADAATDGNYVAAAVTNAPVTVSNGCFSVTLDFGSAVFDGSPRWLEVSVRTNGSLEPYTVLLPRQAVAATPYAVFAGTAGTVRSVDGANILPGTITSRQMEPATWQQVTNNSYAGAFEGNGAGLTNLSGGNIQASSITGTQVVFAGLNANQLDNATWLLLQRANFGAYSNLNRYAWKRTMGKLYNNQPVRILSYGDGLIPNGCMDPIIDRLQQQVPAAGSLTTGFGSLGGSAAWVLGPTTNWLMDHVKLRAVNDTARTYARSFNVCFLYYATTADGGSFRIQQSCNGGAWTNLPAPYDNIDARHPAGEPNVGKVICWTNPAVSTVSFGAQATSAGTTLVLGAGGYNTNINGVIRGMIARTGIGWGTLTNVSRAIWGPIVAFMDPDMLLIAGVSSIRDAYNGYSELNFWKTNNPNLDVVVGAQFPLSSVIDGNGVVWDEDTKAGNAYLRALCQTHHFAFFDGYTPFGGYTNMVARGLIRADPYDPHMTALGYSYYNEFLWSWLDLMNMQQLP